MALATQWSPSYVHQKGTLVKHILWQTFHLIQAVRGSVCWLQDTLLWNTMTGPKRNSHIVSLTKQFWNPWKGVIICGGWKAQVLAVAWIGKKPVFSAGIYTTAPHQQLPEINRKQKTGSIQKVTCPPINSAYNKYVGGVDNDQMKSYYTIPGSGNKWWIRILFDKAWQLDKAVLNAFSLKQESQHHRRHNLKSFCICLAKLKLKPIVARQVERHFPLYLPSTEKGRRMERCAQSVSDAGKFKRTRYFCPECEVGLCAAPCFRI